MFDSIYLICGFFLPSPAHCAAAKGSVECLRLLRAAGGDLWIRNAKGDYPIHEAAVAHQNGTTNSTSTYLVTVL